MSSARTRPRRGPRVALLALLAACADAGGGAPEDGAAASEAPGDRAPAGPAAAEGGGGAAAAWPVPDGFRVTLVATERTQGLPRALEHLRTGVELVLVAAGAFELGSTEADPGHGPDEAPARRVEIEAFYVARTEVTARQWRLGGGAGGRADGDPHPIAEVTWHEAEAWCAANGLVLPSEAQWEYAASGPDDRIFPWGDEPSRILCNALGDNAGDRWDRTAPVGSFPDGRSWCGALDLAGNVNEWCRDPWTADHAAPPDPARRVLRGGSYTCRPPICIRTAYRDGAPPDARAPNLGFRPALAVDG